MRTLLITDLHFADKPRGLLAAQKKSVLNLLTFEEYDDIIMMGDLMMNRKPSPSVLLALKDVVDYCADSKKPLTIIRGNHDSETKANDGTTALSMFDYHAKVVTQTWYDHKTKRAFIPHYEDDERIKLDLAAVPKKYCVFGHFGYRGALNSAGDADFDLKLSDFPNTSFLGHVHRYVKRKNVTILGTPYTTNFGEWDKASYYAILDKDTVELKTLSEGPRHILLDYKDLHDNLDFINESSWFTMLRVLVDKDSGPIPYEELNVPFLDIKWKPSFDEDELSTYTPDRRLFTLNEIIIEDYVDSSNTSLSKEDIMGGYKLIKNED